MGKRKDGEKANGGLCICELRLFLISFDSTSCK